LLVRPLTEHGFEIVAGARRYRAAQMAEAATVPVRIVHLSDAETLEAHLVENLMRREVRVQNRTIFLFPYCHPVIRSLSNHPSKVMISQLFGLSLQKNRISEVLLLVPPQRRTG
jgi:ParB-like nuclease domain